MASRPISVLSLGAGVQSTTVLLMSCRGQLPKLDAAIFADTQWEPAAVYEHLHWLVAEAAQFNIPVHIVSKGNIRKHTIEGFIRGSKAHGKRYATLPLRVLNTDGTNGMLRRQCTREYKIEPIERFIRRKILGMHKHQSAPAGAVDQWFGISCDELRRVRFSEVRWKQHVYPLCNLPDNYLVKPMSRLMCIEWLGQHYPNHSVPKSSCIGCPYHTNANWREVKRNPNEWADVLAVDNAIRWGKNMDGQAYLHRSCRPLAEADLDENQLTLGFEEECLGYCGN